MTNDQCNTFLTILLYPNIPAPVNDYLADPLPVIKWMEKEMPKEWDKYLTGYTSRDVRAIIPEVLDLRNLVTFLSENGEWGEKECPQYVQSRHSSSAECSHKGTERCGNECNGTGFIKSPALLYLESLEVGNG